MLNILVLEDDKGLNRSISARLSHDEYNVTSAYCIDETQYIIHNQTWDMIISDINLPDGNGFDFCSRIGRKSSKFFLFLTVLDSEEEMLKGYQLGADDYITKPFSLEVLSSKVSAILGRNNAKTSKTIINNELILYPTEKYVTLRSQTLSLTVNEWKLINLFMNNLNHILSKNQILNALCENDNQFFDDNTVSVNIRRLREKIEDNPSKPNYIKNIRGLGYVMEKLA